MPEGQTKAMAPRSSRALDTDHDLLIRIDTKVEMLAQSVSQMHVTFDGRMARLEAEKAASSDLDTLRRFIEKEQEGNRKTQEDNHQDIEWSKKMIWMALGGMVVINLVIAFAMASYFKR